MIIEEIKFYILIWKLIKSLWYMIIDLFNLVTYIKSIKSNLKIIIDFFRNGRIENK